MLALAILTRKVKNKDFTTLNLRIISYLMTLTVGLGFSIYYFLFFLNVEEHIDFSVLIILLNLVIFLCLGLVLFPPLLPILKEKWKVSAGWKQVFQTSSMWGYAIIMYNVIQLTCLLIVKHRPSFEYFCICLVRIFYWLSESFNALVCVYHATNGTVVKWNGEIPQMYIASMGQLQQFCYL